MRFVRVNRGERGAGRRPAGTGRSGQAQVGNLCHARLPIAVGGFVFGGFAQAEELAAGLLGVADFL